jgi:hypothetical protein
MYNFEICGIGDARQRTLVGATGECFRLLFLIRGSPSLFEEAVMAEFKHVQFALQAHLGDL